MMLLVSGMLVLLAGAAIGATSIGGVLVVPALAGLAGLPLGAAVAASSFGFLLTGLLGWRRAPSPGAALAATWPLHAAALPGAVAGAVLVHQVPPGLVRGWVALLALGSGVYSLITLHSAPSASLAALGRGSLAVLGAAVGCGSALSGTGGPVLLMPVLMLLGVPTLAAVATAQAVQLPIALAASAAHWASGRLDLGLSTLVGMALLAGAWAGRRAVPLIDVLVLRRCTALALIATGLWYGLA
ncbi:sulfite exporter TauE/SafE family protein [uncultured Azohydromonas sp.]|uniref:sulfite exporter TauE/SafE family protein n=1 Tax=uncultured Azohydromonas sp. TaxID=487342 RepID=UPI00262E5B52|nr:sulfite exporter TauE/SafE family protein [uncultured Azohydromonas sp.]